MKLRFLESSLECRGNAVPEPTLGKRSKGADRPPKRLALAATLAAAAVQCAPPASPEEQNRPGRPADGPPTPVATARAETGSIASFYLTTATLEAEKTAPVLARVQGVVQSIEHEEGDAVDEGRLLLRIENAEYKLRLEQAQARTAQLRDRYARLKGMVEKDLVPVEEFETIRHDLRSAKAEEGLAQLALSRTRVRAPFAGRVIRRMVEIGRTVADGTALFELADLEPLLARVFVPSKEFRRLTPNQPVELQLDSSGARLTGKVLLVSPVIDPQSGTIKVTVEISSYPADTRPGDFATVRIVTERHEDTVIIPKLAVIAEREDRAVFIVSGRTAERRRVRLGFEEDGKVEILEGVRPGEMVVTKGQHRLKNGEPVKVLDSTPEHQPKRQVPSRKSG